MIDINEIVEIGKFQKTHALKGELNAILEVDEDYIQEGNPLIVEMEGIPVPFFAESVRPKGATTCLVKLKGVDSIEQAAEFVNKIIFTPRSNLVDFFEVEDGEILFGHDYVGYLVRDTDEGDLGKVVRFDDSTENTLLVVERPDGSEVMIPFVDEMIVDVDDDEKLIEVSIPEGLLDINN